MVMVDIVETALDVPFDDPLVRRIGPTRSGRRLGESDGSRVRICSRGVATRPLRDETRTRRAGSPPRRSAPASAGQRPERPCPGPWRTQRPELARFSAFGDHHAPDRHRMIVPRCGASPSYRSGSVSTPWRRWMDRTVTRSEPAERAPRLLAMRRHAIRRLRGSGDPVPHVPVGAVRLRPNSTCRVCLECREATPCQPDKRSPPFSFSFLHISTHVLVPFAMWPAFPASDYYGTSAPRHGHGPTSKVCRPRGRTAAMPGFRRSDREPLDR